MLVATKEIKTIAGSIPRYDSDAVLRYFFKSNGEAKEFYVERDERLYKNIAVNHLLSSDKLQPIIKKLIKGSATVGEFECFVDYMQEHFVGMVGIQIEPFYFQYLTNQQSYVFPPAFTSGYWEVSKPEKLPQLASPIQKPNFKPHRVVNTLLWHIWVVSHAAHADNEEVKAVISDIVDQVVRARVVTKSIKEKMNLLKVVWEFTVRMVPMLGLRFLLMQATYNDQVLETMRSMQKIVHDSRLKSWVAGVASIADNRIRRETLQLKHELLEKVSVHRYSEFFIDCVMNDCLNIVSDGLVLGKNHIHDNQGRPIESEGYFRKIIERSCQHFLYHRVKCEGLNGVAFAYDAMDDLNMMLEYRMMVQKMFKVESSRSCSTEQNRQLWVNEREAIIGLHESIVELLVQKGLYQEYPPLVHYYHLIMNKQKELLGLENKLKNSLQGFLGKWVSRKGFLLRSDWLGVMKDPDEGRQALLPEVQLKLQEAFWQVVSKGSFSQACQLEGCEEVADFDFSSVEKALEQEMLARESRVVADALRDVSNNSAYGKLKVISQDNFSNDYESRMTVFPLMYVAVFFVFLLVDRFLSGDRKLKVSRFAELVVSMLLYVLSVGGSMNEFLIDSPGDLLSMVAPEGLDKAIRVTESSVAGQLSSIFSLPHLSSSDVLNFLKWPTAFSLMFAVYFVADEIVERFNARMVDKLTDVVIRPETRVSTRNVVAKYRPLFFQPKMDDMFLSTEELEQGAGQERVVRSWV